MLSMRATELLKTDCVNRIIMDSLGIGKAGCSIKTECILEGELVVYSELVSCCHLLQDKTFINTRLPL